MKTLIHEEPRILAAAERQMHTWAMTQEIEDRAIRSRGVRPRGRCGVTYVAISRESGTDGAEIARQLGRELGWEVLDKNLLDRIAQRFREARDMLDLVDETGSNWVFDVLGTWMDHAIIPHEKYVAHLRREILAAAREKNVIIVGRGAQFLLPRQQSLVVRLIASETYRIGRIMARQGLAEAAARQFVRQTDEGRHEFVRRFFHRNPCDPHLYDLVLNVEHLGPAGVVQLIAAALGR